VQNNYDFDLIVIGGGPGGYVCAIRAAQLGLNVACVELSAHLGGTCLNVGCIPSKALLESSHLWEMFHDHSEAHGISCEKIQLNLSKMLGRKNQIVESLTRGIAGLFKKNKIRHLNGVGSFKSSHEIYLDHEGRQDVFSFKNLVIAAGSLPVELSNARFDRETIVSSTEALDFSTVPKHLIVIGAGVVGLELGSVWRRLGARVSVIEAQEKILGPMDAGISQAALKALKRQGIEFYLSTSLAQAKVEAQSVFVEAVAANGEEKTLEGDKLLVAVGRRANTDLLNCLQIGIKRDKQKRILIDSLYSTDHKNIFAIGDVVRGPMLAHKAEEEGVAVAEIIAGEKGHVNYDAIPSVVYTHPEIASVGKSEEDCKRENCSYRTGQFPFLANGRAKCSGQSEGFVKILSEKNTDEVLGIHIIGPQASELIAEAVIAMEYRASAEDIARSVHAHPTLAETLKEAALAVHKRAIHM